jgi:DNA-binding PucR family transcriptional regulator
MHAERAAGALHIHQNTLCYRVARVEELAATSMHDTPLRLRSGGWM